MTDTGLSPEDAGRILEQSRGGSNNPKVPRGIVLIESTERARIKDYYRVGFDAYLVRPVRPSSLVAQLRLNQRPPSAAPIARSAGAMLAPSPKSSGRYVLFAEDNDINALLGIKLLEHAGAEVLRVSNGSEAKVAFARSSEPGGRLFDLIFMDVQMPEIDGIAAAREIRALEATSGRTTQRVPIVALTANAFVEDRHACIAAGMDDYLAKPFERADLLAILDRWCPAITAFGGKPGPVARKSIMYS
jgi:CheY-like chemotaxis protein